MTERNRRVGEGRATMDFFGRQEHTQRATRRMLVFFALSVISVVSMLLGVLCLCKAAFVYPMELDENFGVSPWPHASTLWCVGIGIAAIMGLVSWSRIRMLGSGGWVVMRHIGANEVDSDTTDPVHRRLYNIVQEMAIAASVPMPDVYVLERESSINAFAAGHGPSDAAICVTRGALDRLNRDELQGVVAHEFSHIAHGDMQLNIRLLGLMAGIFFVASTGRSMMRSDGEILSTLSNGNKSALITIAGMVLFLIGSIGHLVGRLTQSSISRSREFMADAAALQYTRQQLGLFGALKKTLALEEGSYLNSFDPNEYAHMLFGEGKRWRGLLAAHPPVPDRIRALGMPYREQDIKRITRSWQESPSARPSAPGPFHADHGVHHAAESMRPLHEPATPFRPAVDIRTPAQDTAAPSTPSSVASSVGSPSETAVTLA